MPYIFNSPIIGTTDLGNFLRRDLSADDLATIVVNAASDLVRSYCGQAFLYTPDDTIRVTPQGSSIMLLPELPVWSVSEVTVDPDGEDPTVLVEGTDYRISPEGLVYRIPIFRTWGYLPIEITYSHGWSIESDDSGDDLVLSMPADLRFAALTTAGTMYEAGTMTNFSGTAGSWTYAEILNPAVRMILDKYAVHQDSNSYRVAASS